jgi:Ca2+-binding EF-hand superfamily protein
MKLRLGVLAAFVVAFCGVLRAEDAPGVNNAAPNPEQLKKQLLEKFDANGDGNLTGQELLNAQQAMIKQFGTGGGAGGFNFDEFKKKFDRDGDGQLSPQEQAAAIAAFKKARASGGGAPATGVLPGGGAGALPGGIPAGGGFGGPAAGGEGGKVRGREAMIKRFDRNGDGKLSDDEKAEAQKALKAKKGERPAAGKLSEAMKKFDEDGDGKLSDEEKAAAKKDLAEKRKGKKPE